jgi:hypothetical protein
MGILCRPSRDRLALATLTNKCGPGQPPEPHRSWISRLAFSPPGAARRCYWSDSAHEERHIYQYWLRSADSRNRTCATSAVLSQQPNPFTEREVEEAAMPGQPARARARFRMSLAIHPRELPVCHWRHRNHRSTSLRVLTYSLNSLWVRKSRTATEKHFALVQKLWTMRLPCGRLRKSP